MRRTTLATLAALCVLFLALAGCGGDPKPRHAKPTAPAPTPSASVLPTPTDPVPPVMPAAAREHTVLGAKAFARYFTAVISYSTISLDPVPLRSISSDYCDGCSSAVAVVEREVKKKATVTGGTWTLNSINVVQLRAGSRMLMRVTAKGHSTREVVRYSGEKRDVYPAGATKDRFILIPTAGGWTVDTWEVLS